MPYPARASRTQPLRVARRGFKINHAPLAASIAANLLLIALLASPSPPDTMISDVTAPVIAGLTPPDPSAFPKGADAVPDHAPPYVETDRSAACLHPAPVMLQPTATSQRTPSTTIPGERRLRLASHAVTRARPADSRTRHPALSPELDTREIYLRALDGELRSLRSELSRVHTETSPQINAALIRAQGEIERRRVRLVDVQADRVSRMPLPADSAKPPLRSSAFAENLTRTQKQLPRCAAESDVGAELRLDIDRRKRVPTPDVRIKRDGQRETPAPGQRIALTGSSIDARRDQHLGSTGVLPYAFGSGVRLCSFTES